MWWLPRVLGGEANGQEMLSFVPFCKEHCRWKSRAALIIWHCRPLVPCFALSFRLVRVCVGACGGICRSRISWSADGSGTEGP